MHIHHRFRTEVTDSRLEADAAAGGDAQEPVKADCAADVAAERYADAAHFRADALRLARHSFLPAELFRATVERIFQKCAGGVQPLAVHHRAELRLPFRAINAADSHLIEAEFARGFGDDGFDDDNSLQAAGRALRAAWRGVGQHGYAAPAHRLRLIQQGNDAAGRK